jgi:putative membrane protein
MADHRPHGPRAVRLDAGAPPAGKATAKAVTVVPETESVDPPVAEERLPRRARGFGWVTVLGSALSGLAMLAVGLWVERTVTDLLKLYPLLGWLALACALVALLALLVLLGRMVRDVLHERRIEALRARAEAALEGGTLDTAAGVARDLLTLYNTRPQTAAGRAVLDAALPDLFAPRDVFSVAERALMLPLDEAAKAEIGKAARQVSLVTAVSPRAIVDIAFVLVACTRLLRSIATIYGGRPGMLGLFRLARSVFSHLVVTGGMAAGDALIQQVLGQGLAARLSAKLGEGVLNGLLTARVGLAAMAVCRPLPFVDARQPTLTDVAGDLVAWRTKTGE